MNHESKKPDEFSQVPCYYLNMPICLKRQPFDITRLQLINRLVPRAFDGFCIAHISDLHNRRFPEGPEQLAAAIRAQSPDIIAVTGDLIDRHCPDIETAMGFIRLAVTIAPVYYSPGNHEFMSGKYDALKAQLKQAGVHVLEDASETIEKNGSNIVIAGLSDPAFFNCRSNNADKAVLAEREAALCRLALQGQTLFVLLSHKPELLPIYARSGVSLALCGHAHGGQVRLPFVGGLLAPGQGIFPRYTSGMYKEGEATMIVSRGLGGRFTRLRVFNRPELVMVTLSAL